MDASHTDRSPSRPSTALGEFLRSRRARLLPQEVGLDNGRRRRVQGLRREEVSSLAGLSQDYYTRLEQGRHPHPSPGVLDALATALRLSCEERRYLYELATPRERHTFEADLVRPETARLMRALDPTPAVLLGVGMDVLHANESGHRLYAGLTGSSRNALDWMLSDPRAKDLYGEDWTVIAAEMVGMLRLRSGRRLRTPGVERVVGRLTASSTLFRELWHQQTVPVNVRPVKRFQHPEAGRVEMSVESLQVSRAPGQVLVVFAPLPGSSDECAWQSAMARPAPVHL